jgi:uncharacterized protein (TIGR03118 family)
MSLRIYPLTVGALLVAATSGAALALPSVASANSATSGVDQVNLVSDVPGQAPLTDPDLINPWGMSFTSTSKVWVSNAGTGVSTLYGSAPGSGIATKSSTVRVTIPGTPSLPTGQVAYTGKGFQLSNGTVSSPAQFIFVTGSGRLEAWSQDVDPSLGDAEIKATVPGAGYTGVTEATSSAGDELFAADFFKGTVDVYNSKWQQVKTGTRFTDPKLPKGYSPFNVEAINGHIFVTYDTFDQAAVHEVDALGAGAVDEYTVDGKLVGRIATHGPLNAPWGLAVAPASWGETAGDLLIGNLGDGHINIVKAKGDNTFENGISGQVMDNKTHQPLAIDGLWALKPGTPTMGGTDSVWFNAGPEDGKHGLLGLLLSH